MVRTIALLLVAVAINGVAAAADGGASTSVALARPAQLSAGVTEALARAHQLVTERRSGSDEFRDAVRQAGPSFSLMDAVYAAGTTRWRAYTLNGHGQQFDGLRFRTPPGRTSDMFWAFMRSSQSSVSSWYIMPVQGPQEGFGFSYFTPLRNVQLEGQRLPAENRFIAQPLVGAAEPTRLQPETEYIIWFDFATNQPEVIYAALNVVESGLGTDCPASVARVLGLRPAGIESACALGVQQKVAGILRANPAAATQRTRDGSTLLHAGIESGNPQVVALLLAAGADPNAGDNEGLLPLRLAVQEGSLASVRLLLAKGARVEDLSKEGDTALLLAVRDKNRPIAELLVRAGGDLDARDRWGQTALMIAAADGETGLIELLLDLGADVHARTKEGETALHCAAANGCAAAANLLLAKGAQVNAQTGAGTTALHGAARGGHTDVVTLLLAAGADPNARRADGGTPVDWAARGGHLGIVELLESHGAVE